MGVVVRASFESGIINRVNADTYLWRQVHPHFIRDNQVTSQVFTPTPKDEGRLSTYDGNQISAEASWKHYTTQAFDKPAAYDSAGVVTVTVEECEAQETTVVRDSDSFPEHVLVDFTQLPKSKHKTVAKELSRIARERGWQYLPPTSLS